MCWTSFVDDAFVYLTAPEKEVEVTVGSPIVSLSVDIASPTKPTLTWLHNNIPISKDNTHFKPEYVTPTRFFRPVRLT